MTDKRSVSVAMPVFNAGAYLNEQVDSILCELEPGDELVISYDPSEDDTLERIRQYASRDPRVRVVMNEKPGIAGNFENAIRNCTGSVIFLSDQDDRWIAGKVKAVLSAFSNPRVGLVFHNGYHTDEALNIVGEDLFTRYRVHKPFFLKLLMPRYTGCCMAFRKSFTQAFLPFPENIDAYDAWIGLIGELRREIFFLPEKLILHRLHGDNATPKNVRPIPRIIGARLHLFRALMKRRPGKRSK
ncbi:MAG: glycosyltransferase [Clostridiaceae bacterium]|nr:glycosyltransferase [Clostridiaceae bacterium]